MFPGRRNSLLGPLAARLPHQRLSEMVQVFPGIPPWNRRYPAVITRSGSPAAWASIVVMIGAART